MIPTMILFGLVLGRWWRVTIAAAAVFWPVLLLVTGVAQQSGSLVSTLLGAALLAALNAAVGAAVHQLTLGLFRGVRGLFRTRSPA